MKSSPSIWRYGYVVNGKYMVRISSIFVAFLENMNFKKKYDLSLNEAKQLFGWFVFSHWEKREPKWGQSLFKVTFQLLK